MSRTPVQLRQKIPSSEKWREVLGARDRWQDMPKADQHISRLRAQVRKMTDGTPAPRGRGRLLLEASVTFYTDPEEFIADVKEAIARGKWARVPGGETP